MDNLKEAEETLDAFFGQFEKDIYNNIALEILFREIYAKNIPISGKKGQEGDQTS